MVEKDGRPQQEGGRPLLLRKWWACGVSAGDHPCEVEAGYGGIQVREPHLKTILARLEERSRRVVDGRHCRQRPGKELDLPDRMAVQLEICDVVDSDFREI